MSPVVSVSVTSDISVVSVSAVSVVSVSVVSVVSADSVVSAVSESVASVVVPSVVSESVVSAVSGTSGMDEAFSVLSPSLPSGSRPSVAMTSGFVHAGTAAALPSTTEMATSKRERRRVDDFMAQPAA